MKSIRENKLWQKWSYKHIIYIHISLYICIYTYICKYIYIYKYGNKVNIYGYMYV